MGLALPRESIGIEWLGGIMGRGLNWNSGDLSSFSLFFASSSFVTLYKLLTSQMIVEGEKVEAKLAECAEAKAN